MSDREHDAEIDELRALYQRLQPGPLPDDAADADPETARTVEWMRAAWAQVEAPSLTRPSPHLAPARPTPLRRAWLRRPRLALAAALLALLGGSVLVRALRPLDDAPDPLVARRPDEAPGNNTAGGDIPISGVEVVDVRSDRVELRSGPVRLLLLAPPSALDPQEKTSPTENR